MSKVNIKQLGIEFKATKSEKKFKMLFDAMRPSVLNYYKKFNNPIEVIEDAFNEAMISIWNDIDKLEVEQYSISTMVYLKTKQKILSLNKKSGGQYSNYDIDDPVVTNIVLSENSESAESMTYDMQDDYIRDESVETLWEGIRSILNNETSFNILYDKYANNMKSKDIAEKYNTKEQNVLNRVFNAKKKIQENDQLYYDFIV